MGEYINTATNELTEIQECKHCALCASHKRISIQGLASFSAEYLPPDAVRLINSSRAITPLDRRANQISPADLFIGEQLPDDVPCTLVPISAEPYKTVSVDATSFEVTKEKP